MTERSLDTRIQRKDKDTVGSWYVECEERNARIGLEKVDEVKLYPAMLEANLQLKGCFDVEMSAFKNCI